MFRQTRNTVGIGRPKSDLAREYSTLRGGHGSGARLPQQAQKQEPGSIPARSRQRLGLGATVCTTEWGLVLGCWCLWEPRCRKRLGRPGCLVEADLLNDLSRSQQSPRLSVTTRARAGDALTSLIGLITLTGPVVAMIGRSRGVPELTPGAPGGAANHDQLNPRQGGFIFCLPLWPAALLLASMPMVCGCFEHIRSD